MIHFLSHRSPSVSEITQKMAFEKKNAGCTNLPKSSVTTHSTGTGFQLEGLLILKAFMNSTYYSLAFSYTFKWDGTKKKFQIVEFLPQKVLKIIQSYIYHH